MANNEYGCKFYQVLPENTEAPYHKEVADVLKNLTGTKQDAVLWREKGLALAKKKLFNEAVRAFSGALAADPFDWLTLRHRGHRFLSVCRFEEALADFELAYRINPEDWDVMYHLALSRYLTGDNEGADDMYSRCISGTKKDDPNMFAVVNWKHVNLMRLGKNEEAQKVLDMVDLELDPEDNKDYKDNILVYKGLLTAQRALAVDKDDPNASLAYATKGYGIAMHLYYTGKKAEAKEIFDNIIKNNDMWYSFGNLAAQQDKSAERLTF